MTALIDPIRQLTSAIGGNQMTTRFERLSMTEPQEVFELLKEPVIEQTNFVLMLYEPAPISTGVKEICESQVSLRGV